MAWKDIKDPDSVLKSIAECRRLGRDEFLKLYGFHEAKKYFLIDNNDKFDSKAILGVAHKYEFPKQGPLKPGEFAGGYNTVKRILERMGFKSFPKGKMRITWEQ